ncbi:ABC-F family ATP-binding cassette domain-containing protein [Phycisphaerales bacterium AB-hyl4]|uniref:ABC-F family ATP-binding cassette domain-containing protein n=1 Tax=Natronomicrosphaera hydrolytica TaxID=3242702 RepID=A0ABV4U5D3_9BACT
MALLLTCENLTKTFGTRSLFEGVALSIQEGDRVGLIGPNGSGKSTLLKILAGLETADVDQPGDGSAKAGITSRKNLRVGYVAQQDAFDEHATLLDVLADGLTDQFHDAHDREQLAYVALSKVGLDDPSVTVGSLSGGWRKRVALARELAREPDVLLMDEPTNHLDVRGIEWLEQILANQPFASVVVTHDRYFLERAVSRVVELNRTYPAGVFSVDGPYSTFLQRRADFLESQQQQQQSLASKVREDIRWLSRGAKARRTKSKSRIDASHGRMDELADLKSRNAPGRAAGVQFAASGRQTQKLLVATGLAKSLGGRLLFRDLDLMLSPGTCIGLLGENGSGKTTLIRLLTGELSPDEGTIKRADNLRTVVFTQAREELDPRQSLRDALAHGGDFVTFRDKPVHVNAWASRFLFDAQQLKVSVGDLSGGEQARILMARLMLKPADLLILDEPTNDLDIASLEVLEQSLSDFPGAIMLVTHDRFMLDRLSTDILALDGAGGAKFYAELAQWQNAQDEAESRQKKRGRSGEADRNDTGSATAVAAPATKVKLSYKEQRELDQMESNITAAEAEVARLEALMADPDVLADHARLTACCRDLESAQAKVTKLYKRWEVLESRRA